MVVAIAGAHGKIAMRLMRLLADGGNNVIGLIRTLVDGWAYRAVYRSSHERTAALRGFLEFYNSRRPHRALGGRSPTARLTELTNLAGAYT